ncbi:MAG: AMP-binding protein [Burkholderiaceae bacterium]|nr:AMP-binding protein [Burkholderiaceae bacterium]
MMAKHRLQGQALKPNVECLPRKQLAALQNERLQKLLVRLANTSPFYQEKLAPFRPRLYSVNSSTLKGLPFTTKADLREKGLEAFLTLPKNKLLRLHASSGSTGKPTVVAYSENDLALWAQMTARALGSIGVGPGVLVQNAYGFGLGTGGLGFQLGIEQLKAIQLPTGVLNVEKQFLFLKELKSEVLLCTPSLASALTSFAKQTRQSLADLSLKAAVLGGEIFSPSLQRRLEAFWGIKVYGTYGLSEILGPGVAHACEAGAGMHLYEDHFLAEVIDPVNGALLKETQEEVEGELVLTTLTKQAMPLLRYRTQDRVRLTRKPCICGRTTARLVEVKGRDQEAFMLNGHKIYLSEIEELALQFPELEPHYQIVLHPILPPTLQIEVNPDIQSAELRIQLEKALEAALEQKFVGAHFQVHLFSPHILPRFEGKAQRLQHFKDTVKKPLSHNCAAPPSGRAVLKLDPIEQ